MIVATALNDTISFLVAWVSSGYFTSYSLDDLKACEGVWGRERHSSEALNVFIAITNIKKLFHLCSPVGREVTCCHAKRNKNENNNSIAMIIIITNINLRLSLCSSFIP